MVEKNLFPKFKKLSQNRKSWNNAGFLTYYQVNNNYIFLVSGFDIYAALPVAIFRILLLLLLFLSLISQEYLLCAVIFFLLLFLFGHSKLIWINYKEVVAERLYMGFIRSSNKYNIELLEIKKWEEEMGGESGGLVSVLGFVGKGVSNIKIRLASSISDEKLKLLEQRVKNLIELHVPHHR